MVVILCAVEAVPISFSAVMAMTVLKAIMVVILFEEGLVLIFFGEEVIMTA